MTELCDECIRFALDQPLYCIWPRHHAGGHYYGRTVDAAPAPAAEPREIDKTPCKHGVDVESYTCGDCEEEAAPADDLCARLLSAAGDNSGYWVDLLLREAAARIAEQAQDIAAYDTALANANKMIAELSAENARLRKCDKEANEAWRETCLRAEANRDQLTRDLHLIRCERDEARECITVSAEKIARLTREREQAVGGHSISEAKLTRAREELQHIANADPATWDISVRDQFQQWAQNRARAFLAEKP